MRDSDEKVSQTLKREFMEEALDSLKMDDGRKLEIENKLQSLLFENGVEVLIFKLALYLFKMNFNYKS